MFRPAAMRHVLIQVLKEDLPQASLTLADTGVFNPDHRESDEHRLQEIPGDRYRQIYRQAASRLDKITEHFPEVPEFTLTELQVVTERELDALNNRLGSLWQECSVCQEDLRRADDELRLVEQLQGALDSFANLNVDLSLLQGEKSFLELRIGVVPQINLQRMEEALGLAKFLVYPFLRSEGSTHVVVVGPKGEQVEHVETVLESAGFRPLPVPAELRDQPAQARLSLADRRERAEADRLAVAARIAKRAAETEDFIRLARTRLALAEPYVNLANAARSSSQVAVISGWIPARELERVEQALTRSLQLPFILTSRRPTARERPQVPTLLAPNRLMSAFTTLVTQYGVPRYGEIDPSAVFAVTFVLMFGMMFGDVGHGAVIAAAALWKRRLLGKFTAFAVAAGLSSVAFGFIYGSIFGYEHLLHPLWMSPLSDPILMLKIALGWGVGFLLLMSALCIYNRVMEANWLEAWLGPNGLINVALYLGLLWGGYNSFTGAGFGALPALLVFGSLAALAAFKWHESDAPRGERVMVVLVESFETIMGSISGTLSFLRVAAFSLNHVALAVAVFTLADMLGPTGHWIMVVFGNLFILILEGGIVAIQVLRLEYYEGFTRFYSGDGREFRPLRVNRGAVPVVRAPNRSGFPLIDGT